MLIEVSRAAKLQAITDHISHPRLKQALLEEVCLKILD